MGIINHTKYPRLTEVKKSGSGGECVICAATAEMVATVQHSAWRDDDTSDRICKTCGKLNRRDLLDRLTSAHDTARESDRL